MFVDGRRVEPGSVIDTDLAVIGAGAAGITLARALSGSGIRIALIESGGFEPDAATQDLYAGASTGIPYSLALQRLRYFGGSTNHWNGWCRPLEPLDFEARDWVPHSGWPITRADLDPWYEQAGRICELGSDRFDDPEAWSDGGKYSPLPLPGGEVETRWFLNSPPTRFGAKYRPDIEQAASVQCFLHSNVLEIGVDENASRVERLAVGTLAGGRFEIRPRVCVLAAGGIENARILLLSDRVARAGLGNDRDLVGRFFAEHPHVYLPCEILITDPSLLAAYYSLGMWIGDTIVSAVLMFTEAHLRRQRSLGTVVLFWTAPAAPPWARLVGGDDEDRSRSLHAALTGVLRSTTSTAGAGPAAGVRFATACRSEQIPNPDSRVLLGTERDALGLRRATLDWRLTDADRDGIRPNLLALARAFGRWGEGQVRVLFPDNHDWAATEGGGHHIGTTRMAADPRSGVVDADCKVHGVSNLYVAGSSVFTTSSAVNPTLTIVALALRLAEHLRARFRRGGPG